MLLCLVLLWSTTTVVRTHGQEVQSQIEQYNDASSGNGSGDSSAPAAAAANFTWLLDTFNLTDGFWKRASAMKLPVHPTNSSSPPCKERNDFEIYTGSLYKFDQSTLHLAGDLEVIVLLPVHAAPPSNSSWLLDEVCHEMRQPGHVWLQLELVRLTLQIINGMGLFGRFSFGAEIVDTCRSARRTQAQMHVHGRMSEIACGLEELNNSCPFLNSHHNMSADLMDSVGVGFAPKSQCEASYNTCSPIPCRRRGLRRIVVGPGNDEMSRLTAPFASASNLIQISYGATLPELSNQEDYPSFFRTVPSDLEMVKAMEYVLKELNILHVALMVEDDDLGQELRAKFHELYRDTGCIAISSTFTFSSNDSLRTALDQLENARAVTTVVVLGSPQATATLLEKSTAILSNVNQLLWLVTHVEQTWQPDQDVRLLSFTPVPSKNGFTQRAWTSVRKLLRDRAKQLQFSHGQVTLVNRYLEDIVVAVNEGLTGTGCQDWLVPETCTDVTNSSCIHKALEEAVTASLNDVSQEDDLKRIMEAMLTAAKALYFVMKDDCVPVENSSDHPTATPEVPEYSVTANSPSAAPQETSHPGKIEEETPRTGEEAVHCQQCDKLRSMLVRNDSESQISPKEAGELLGSLFRLLSQERVGSMLQEMNKNEAGANFAYDIIAFGRGNEKEGVEAWHRLGHWEEGSKYLSLAGFTSNHLSTACSPIQCQPGRKKLVQAGTEDCCFKCETCTNTISNATNSRECDSCPRFTKPNLPERGSECIAIPMTRSPWDRGWSLAVAALSGAMVIVIIYVTIWSLHQVEVTHRARQKPQLNRLSSAHSNITSTSTDSVTAKPGRLHYCVLFLLLGGCLFNSLLPFTPTPSLCKAQVLTIPFLTPAVCSVMMLAIINKHRWTFITELIKWKKDQHVSHRYMSLPVQILLVVVCSTLLFVIAVGMAVAGESTVLIEDGFKLYRLCTVPDEGIIVYFVFLWLIFAALLTYAMYSFISAQHAGLIFSRPTSIAWSSGGLLFLWSLLLPAYFVLPRVNTITMLALVNNLHTLVILVAACLADIRVVRRRQRNIPPAFSLLGLIAHGGNLQQSGNNSTNTSGLTSAFSPGFTPSPTCHVMASPLSPSPHPTHDNLKVTTPTTGPNSRMQRFTFERGADKSAKPLSLKVNGDGSKTPPATATFIRQGSLLRRGPSPAQCDDEQVTSTHLQMFNTGEVTTPVTFNDCVVTQTTAL